mmetsp:Transcript_18262/g.41661  ORF Transcript_18262/g.41661 Transcript_18262/m.41661 type:complete len:779 (-) Transcript_18262:95-2431(-)
MGKSAVGKETEEERVNEIEKKSDTTPPPTTTSTPNTLTRTRMAPVAGALIMTMMNQQLNPFAIRQKKKPLDEGSVTSTLISDQPSQLMGGPSPPSGNLTKPLASSFAKRCHFTKAGIGKTAQHYEGLTLNGSTVLMLAGAMKLKGCPTICDEDLRRVEQMYPNQFSRLPDELLLSSGWRRISKYCHFSNKAVPDGVPFFHSKERLHPTGGYYFLLAAAVGMARPLDVEPLCRDHLVLLETDYAQACEAAPPELLSDPTRWCLVDRFCFFSGGPINPEEDVYYEADLNVNAIYMLAFLSPSLTAEELYRLKDDEPLENRAGGEAAGSHGLNTTAAVAEVERVYDLTERDFDDLKLYHLGPCRALPPYLLKPQSWKKVLSPAFLAARQKAIDRALKIEAMNDSGQANTQHVQQQINGGYVELSAPGNRNLYTDPQMQPQQMAYGDMEQQTYGTQQNQQHATYDSVPKMGTGGDTPGGLLPNGVTPYSAEVNFAPTGSYPLHHQSLAPDQDHSYNTAGGPQLPYPSDASTKANESVFLDPETGTNTDKNPTAPSSAKEDIDGDNAVTAENELMDLNVSFDVGPDIGPISHDVIGGHSKALKKFQSPNNRGNEEDSRQNHILESPKYSLPSEQDSRRDFSLRNSVTPQRSGNNSYSRPIDVYRGKTTNEIPDEVSPVVSNSMGSGLSSSPILDEVSPVISSSLSPETPPRVRSPNEFMYHSSQDRSIGRRGDSGEYSSPPRAGALDRSRDRSFEMSTTGSTFSSNATRGAHELLKRHRQLRA